MGMSDKEAIIIVMLTYTMLVVVVLIAWLVKTRDGRRYRGMKRPRETNGVITRTEYISGDTADFSVAGGFVVEYSFCDSRGVTYCGRFTTAEALYHKGDSITVYYEDGVPQNHLSKEQLKQSEKSKWKLPLVGIAIIVGPVIFGLLLVLVSHIIK